jgi:hypothetical protein
MRLNADAANGYLSSFELAAPDSHNLVGVYDNSTITLPADSFGAGSANLAATLRTQHMLMEFSRASRADAAGGHATRVSIM